MPPLEFNIAMRLFGFVIRLFLYLCLLSPIFILLFVIFSVQDSPLVAENRQLTAQEIQSVKIFISKNNPSTFKENEMRTTAISETEINLLTRYVLNKFGERIQAKVKLSALSMNIMGTITLPHNPLGDFINFSTRLRQQDDVIRVEQLKVGDIRIPDIIANFLLLRGHNTLQQEFPVYRTALTSLESFNLRQKKVSVHYMWRSEVRDQLKNRITSTLIQDNLKQPATAYTQELIRVSRSIHQSRPALTNLLQPLFKLAVKRSQNNNPVDENRALFIVLGAYMLDKNIVGLWDTNTSSSLPRKAFYLRNREDLSRHFLVSAAITALSGSKLAQTIGLDKELNDSRGGSGFSFADLAADRAGIILAKHAFYLKQARLIQQRLANTHQDSDFMPSIINLPEGLNEIDFKSLYTNTNSETYQQVVKVIDERIAESRLYRHTM